MRFQASLRKHEQNIVESILKGVSEQLEHMQLSRTHLDTLDKLKSKVDKWEPHEERKALKTTKNSCKQEGNVQKQHSIKSVFSLQSETLDEAAVSSATADVAAATETRLPE